MLGDTGILKFAMMFDKEQDNQVLKDLDKLLNHKYSNMEILNMALKDLKTIAKWNIEARNDSNGGEYVYVDDEMKGVLEGEKTIVTGMKGVGKTSILEKIKYDCKGKEIPFNQFDLASFDNSLLSDIANDTNNLQGFWQEMIYSIAIDLVVPLAGLGETSGIGQFTQGVIGTVTNLVKNSDINVKVGNLELTKRASKNNAHWQQRSSETQQFFNDIIKESKGAQNLPAKIFITFDRIDAKFTANLNSREREEYISNVTGLILAVISILNDNRTRQESLGIMGVQIIPVITVRSDIYDLIVHPEKINWTDRLFDMTWRPDRMKNLIKHRFSVVTGKEYKNFGEAWNAIFGFNYKMKDRRDTDNQNRPLKKTAFDFIKSRSFWRPRDFVKFISLAAQNASENHSESIELKHIIWATDAYAQTYTKVQLIDEGAPHLPQLLNQDFFDIIGDYLYDHPQKKLFSKDNLNEMFAEYSESEIEDIIKKLYQLNVLGTYSKNETDPLRKNSFVYKSHQRRSSPVRNRDFVFHLGAREFLLA